MVPLKGRQLARLAEQRGLGPELFDPAARGGELGSDGGDLAVSCGQLGGCGQRLGGLTEAVDPVLVLTAGIGQVASGAVVRNSGGVSDGGELCVFGVELLREAAGVASDGGPRAWWRARRASR
ncbi:hypothetical protein JOD57_001845 [Geodermatophilus bullaregiensis]|uniref:hypothetical protein n=1 Tax=Geodermatophilus bullaregiensis TaxID=1564160 RepID=UPI001EF7D350|nr:hypothetical protein [Geodermatophilus bullaregiensis]MBM7806008.1 hypothetical protein [Geodermatophilus bullaregiensis]